MEKPSGIKIGHLGVISDGAYETLYNNEHQAEKAKRRTRAWTIPALRAVALRAQTVLSVGCGNGMDVVALREAGYDALGMERHEVADRARGFVTITDAATWPLADRAFDATLALEVIEHVGVDSGFGVEVERAKFAREAIRVTRRGGVIVLATPNRTFPVDEHGSPVRIHSPFNDATLTAAELEDIFARRMFPLPYGGYFAFERFGRMTHVAAKLDRALAVFDNPWLHRSPLNPHLFLWCRV